MIGSPFISLVGTQVMAELNPLLAIMNSKEKPGRIILLPTEMTLEKALTIKNFLVAKKLKGEEDMEVEIISKDSNPDTDGRRPAHEIVGEKVAGADRFYFNIAGGMGFQIVYCINVIDPEKCVFIYPEREGVIQINLVKDGVKKRMLPNPDPVDILMLQGIKTEKEEKEENKEADDLLKSFFRDIKFDPDLIDKYTVAKNVKIAGIHFVRIWNMGNVLRFLTIIDKKNYNSEAILRKTRELIGFAYTREKLSELYDRSIGVITNNKLVAERLRTEGMGKIDVIEWHRQGREDAHKSLKKFLNYEAQNYLLSTRTLTEETGKHSNKSKALYLSLGKDPLPSLLSIWSHKGIKDVHFLYTPHDEEIERLKEGIISNKQLIPGGRLFFHPVSITGTEILNLKPESDVKETEVNLTPGTKSHRAFLAIWAKRHNARIFTIENKKRKLLSIDGTTEVPISGLDPFHLLQLKGMDIKEKGKSIEWIKDNKNYYQKLMGFIKIILQNNKLNDFPQKKIKFEELVYEYFDEKNEYGIVRWHNSFRDNLRIDFSGGQWFEGLIGYVMYLCGAEHVRVRMRINWENSISGHLQKQYTKPFKTDIDVACSLEGTYYVISCKSGNTETKTKEATEIMAVSKNFGRFAIPLVALLKHEKEPDKINGVYFFGPRTFTHIENMKELLKKARREARKE